MPHDPHAQNDQALLDFIEQTPTGAVPHTPTRQDSLARLLVSQQVYPSADHKGGYVTARSLTALPSFHAHNLEEFLAGKINSEDLEPDTSIYNRYLASLPEVKRSEAEHFKALVVSRKIQHRAKAGAVIHDPAHTLLLIPGGGLHPGLPGNYLYGAVLEQGDACGIQLHDREDGQAECMLTSRAAALGVLRDVLASAPFHLGELDALGFHSV